MGVPAFNAIEQRRRARGPGDRAARPATAQAAEQCSARIPAVVLGGTGYVAGELLRLIAAHPQFTLAAVHVRQRRRGSRGGRVPAPRRAPTPSTRFSSQEEVRASCARAPPPRCSRRPRTGCPPASSMRCLSAATAAGHRPARGRHLGRLPLQHGGCLRAGLPPRARRAARASRSSPARCPSTSARRPHRHIAHPGCFATAILLARVPLLKSGLIAPALFVSGVTGSTGSGRKPVEGTHHPLRHGDLYSYSALAHRHAPEIVACALAASGVEAAFRLRAALGSVRARHPRDACRRAWHAASRQPAGARGAARVLRGAPFVRVSARAPRVKDVVASNYAHLSAAANGAHGRRAVRDRQSHQGRRRRRHPVDEPPARPARDRGSHRARRRAGPEGAHDTVQRTASHAPPSPGRHGYLAPVFAQYPLEVASAAGVWLRTAAASACSISTAVMRSQAWATPPGLDARRSPPRRAVVSSRPTPWRCRCANAPPRAWCASPGCPSPACSSSTAAPRPTRTP